MRMASGISDINAKCFEPSTEYTSNIHGEKNKFSIISTNVDLCSVFIIFAFSFSHSIPAGSTKLVKMCVLMRTCP